MQMNKANSGSVSPEKVSTKHKGVNRRISAPTMGLLSFNCRAILKVKKIVSNQTIALKTLTPINPN